MPNTSGGVYYILSADVSFFRIPISPSQPQPLPDEAVAAIYSYIQNTPERFYLANGYGYSYYKDKNSNAFLSKVHFLLYDFEELDYSKPGQLDHSFNSMYQEIESAAAAFLDPLRGADLTDEEKILLVHDYLVSHCKYYTNINEDDREVFHTMYSLFTMGTSVCEGYAKATVYLLKQLNFPVEDMKFMTSRNLGHMWNLIRLDGKWYHYDATWDDPVITNLPEYNALQHKYFLLSNNTNIQRRLPGNESRYDAVCYDTDTIDPEDWSSTKYESGYLFNVDSMLNPSQWDGSSKNTIDSPLFCYENGMVVLKTNLSRLNTDNKPVMTFPASSLKSMPYTFSMPYADNGTVLTSLSDLKNSTIRFVSSETIPEAAPEMIYAFYDQNGAFCGMQRKKITGATVSNNNLSIPADAVSARLFVLESTNTLVPLSSAASLK